MSAILYFFSNLLIHNLIILLIGLILGWLLKKLLGGSKGSSVDFKAKYETEQTKSANLQSQLDTCKKARKDIDASLSTTEGDLGTAKSRISDLEADLAQAKGNAGSVSSDAELAEAKATITDLKAQLAAANADLDTCKSDLGACKADLAAGSKQSTGGDEELRNKNMQFFAADLESGKLKQDEKYGLLYTEPVAEDEQDDLTRIKGVAGVLNKTLNEYGVYKYRQIALWTPQICEDFSERISFKGRIERDDWIGQCKQFHEEKYGEKI